jgi:serine/threonine-protein kinase
VTERARCARCGAQTSPLGCPKCLLREAMEPPPDLPEARPGTRFGDYELIAKIARGGMGVVYRAKKDGLDREVALKMVLAGELADEEENRLFRAEAQAAVMLDHPNIVPVYEVGEVDNCPYFTMRLMEGGTLAQVLPTLRLDRHRGVEVLRAIALAVHYGHQRGVLHRDLKPTNVLLDAQGAPHVADFGTAMRLTDGSVTRSGAVVGTLSYMAPEQAAGDAKRVTTAADVYGLGAIMYELLAGRPPLIAESAQQLLAMLPNAEPPSLRQVDRTIDRDLETICMKCLEKAPERRYTSARALAVDLERWLAGDSIEARPVGRLSRTWRWARRHPVLAGVAAAAALSLLSASTLARRLEEQLRRDTNAYAARMAAGAVLFQLRQDADVVQPASRDPRIIELLERHTPAVLAQPLKDDGKPLEGCDSMQLLDVDGRAVARWPAPPEDHWKKGYGFRDYFTGAMELARSGSHRVHVSKAFHSETDHKLKFSVSAPVYAADGGVLGVIAADFGADAVLGSLRLGVPSDSDRTAALVAPRDRERDGGPPSEYVILVHEGLAHGEDVPFDIDAARGRPCDDYRDPVRGFEGPWLGCFAPVGDTGQLTVVQTRNGPLEVIVRVFLLFGLPTVFGAALFGALRWTTRRKR